MGRRLEKSLLFGDSLWFALRDDHRLIVGVHRVWLFLQNLALLLSRLSVFGSALSYGRGSRRCSFFSQVGLAVGALALGRGRIYVAAYGDSFCV